jgi:CRISPR-associated protein Csm3
MSGLKLKGTIVLKYRIKLLSGLHIGGSKEIFEIGGVDNPVLKLPVEVQLPNGTKLPQGTPYIPGSSLKGKVRSILEWSIKEPKGLDGEIKTSVQYMFEKAYEEYKKNPKKLDAKKLREEAGKACSCGTCSICKLFGVSNVETLKEIAEKDINKLPGPPRTEFSEAYPTEESIELLKQQLGVGLFTEIKTENVLNRITSESIHLRKTERVPAGVEFEGEITVDIYNEDDLELLKKLIQGLQLLETTYLGGSGSRGYGRIKFTSVTLKVRGKDFLEKGEEKEITTVSDIRELVKDFENYKNSIEGELIA